MTKPNPKCMVLSIDGVPFGLMQRLLNENMMPNLAGLAKQVGSVPMRSVHPTVSSVAWASYMTGVNPGKHGIYGFIDRKTGSYDLALPNGSMMAVKNIWQILSDAGKRVFGMNVPTSYPPRPVNGILIGGFLTPTIDKIAYPASEAAYLKSIDYRIDSDAQLARQDKRAMLKDLDTTLDKRTEAMFHYMDQENWDFFHTHIMGSDRINHFLFTKMEQGDEEFAPAFFRYYARIDEAIGTLLNRLPDETPLLIFSDHGFCSIKQEVQLSRFLIEKGWTTPAQQLQHPLSIDPAQSRAYCTIPGRITLNLKGREPGGIVPVEEYEQTRTAITNDLMQLKAPDGSNVIRKVLKREEVYWPTGQQGPGPMSPDQITSDQTTFGKAPDLVAIPYDGYDLKLGLAANTVFQQTALEGMHTYDDAFMIARGIDLPKDNLEIMMIARHILETMQVPVPADMDGNGSAVTPDF